MTTQRNKVVCTFDALKDLFRSCLILHLTPFFLLLLQLEKEDNAKMQNIIMQELWRWKKKKRSGVYFHPQRRDGDGWSLWTDSKSSFDKQHRPSNINHHDLDSVKGSPPRDEAQREPLFLWATVSNEATTDATVKARVFINSWRVVVEAKRQKNTWDEQH